MTSKCHSITQTWVGLGNQTGIKQPTKCNSLWKDLAFLAKKSAVRLCVRGTWEILKPIYVSFVFDWIWSICLENFPYVPYCSFIKNIVFYHKLKVNRLKQILTHTYIIKPSNLNALPFAQSELLSTYMRDCSVLFSFCVFLSTFKYVQMVQARPASHSASKRTRTVAQSDPLTPLPVHSCSHLLTILLCFLSSSHYSASTNVTNTKVSIVLNA